jgi:hypothetical protein
MEILILVWLACPILAGMIAARKGSAFAGLLLGALLGPLGVIIALLSPGSTKVCPWCRSRIDERASVCPKCTRDIKRAKA